MSWHNPWDDTLSPIRTGNDDHQQQPLLLSANHLKTWDKCRKRFQLHVLDGLRWPTNPGNFEFGQTIHAMMDHHANHRPIQQVEPHLTPLLSNSYQQLTNHPLAQAPLIASEWAFTLPLSLHFAQAIWLTGRIDRISQTTNDNGQPVATIIDWKTGTAIPKNPKDDWQTRLYLYAAVETASRQLNINYPPEQWAMAYVGVSKKGAMNTVNVPYNQAMHEETEQRLRHTLKTIATSVDYPLPGICPDRYCGYRQVCGINNNYSSPL